MSNYLRFTRDYHIQLANMDKLSSTERSTKSKIETLLNDIELAKAVIFRMSFDRDTGEVTEQAKKRNARAIAEIEERIKLLQSQIELLQTSNAE